MNLILHLNKNNLFNFNYLLLNIYPIVFSSNVLITNLNFNFGNNDKKYTNSKYYLIYKTLILNLNNWISFLEFYINNKNGYFYTIINNLNLEKEFNNINLDINNIEKNIEKINNSNINNILNITETEFNNYFKLYYNDTNNKINNNLFILIPYLVSYDYNRDDHINNNDNDFSSFGLSIKDAYTYFNGLNITNEHLLILKLFHGIVVTDKNNKVTNCTTSINSKTITNDSSITIQYKTLPYYNNIFGKYIIFAYVVYTTYEREINGILIIDIKYNIKHYLCLKLKKPEQFIKFFPGFSIEFNNNFLKTCKVIQTNYIFDITGNIGQAFMNREYWNIISYHVATENDDII